MVIHILYSMYYILLTYFTIKFLGELLLNDDIPETDIRETCRCTMCSGIHILNRGRTI
jgi:hypothetical protein